MELAQHFYDVDENGTEYSAPTNYKGYCWYIVEKGIDPPTSENDEYDFSDVRLHYIGAPAKHLEGTHDNQYYLFQLYYEYGLIHRLDGPAKIEKYVGNVIEEWFLYDNSVNELDYKLWLDNVGIDIHNITDEDKILIEARWNRGA